MGNSGSFAPLRMTNLKREKQIPSGNDRKKDNCNSGSFHFALLSVRMTRVVVGMTRVVVGMTRF
jgi:hypothetical protein